MGGRGSRFTPGAFVMDPLCAFAVILEDIRGCRTLWVSVDLVTLSLPFTDPLRYDLSALTAVPLESIVVNFSHTHSGPMCGFDGYATRTPKPLELQEYEDGLHQQILRLSLEAIQNMQPITATVHRGTSDVGINRRGRNAEGRWGMCPDPNGACNPDLWVLDLRSEESDERCVLFNYGCHPVIAYGHAFDAISSDFPGICRGILKEKLGLSHAQFIQGLAGNVRPRSTAEDDYSKFRKSTPDDTQTSGSGLASDVIETLEGEGEPISFEIASAAGRFLAPRDPSKTPPLSHFESLLSSSDELSRNLGEYWVDRNQKGIPPVQAVPWGIGLMQIARDHRIAWISGEALAEWLDHVRGWLDGPGLIVWGYCQEGRGYLPPDELLSQGGYEIDGANTFNVMGPGPFATGLNESMRRSFLNLAQRVEWNNSNAGNPNA